MDRLNAFRERLHRGESLTVKETLTLLDEIEYVHKCREALLFTMNRIHEMDSQHGKRTSPSQEESATMV